MPHSTLSASFRVASRSLPSRPTGGPDIVIIVIIVIMTTVVIIVVIVIIIIVKGRHQLCGGHLPAADQGDRSTMYIYIYIYIYVYIHIVVYMIYYIVLYQLML